MTLAAPAYLLRRALGTGRSLAAAAAEVVTVAPAETALRPAAFHLPGQLDRVRAFQGMSDPQAQLDRIGAAEVVHAPTLAFRLRDARLLGGCLFAGGARLQMRMDRPPRLPRAGLAALGRAALVGTPLSDVFFGHCLTDDSATALLAARFAPPAEPASRHHAGWTHVRDYRALMGLTLAALGDCRIAEAWVFQDYGMTADRRARLAELRRRLRAAVAAPDGPDGLAAGPAGPRARPGGHGVFILRGASGQALRLLENEAAIAATLAARGFAILDPLASTAAAMAATLAGAGAGLVVGVEGSAMTHALLAMAEGGALVTIQPPFRFDHVLKDYADALGLRYGFVVAEGGRDRFRLDPDDLLRTLDLAG